MFYICTMKNKHGGKRENAGRKQIYGEETKHFQCRVPMSRFKELKIYVKKKLNEWKVK